MRFSLVAAVVFVCGLCLGGCDRPDSAPPQARATPTPTPKDELDAGTNRLEAKAEGALAALENYFVKDNPKRREKFTRDKAKWHDKLSKQQTDLQPEIDRLREELGKVETAKGRDQLRDDLARLEDRSKDTGRKLAELEAASQDAWKAFKARLKAEEARNGTPTPGPSR